MATNEWPKVGAIRFQTSIKAYIYMRKSIILFIFSALVSAAAMAQNAYQPSAENLKARAEFQDQKFGVFLHWGLYSMVGQGEWVMHNRDINYKEYAKLAGAFYPSRFDAERWVAAIKAAGARYITITTRHHDGFSLFKTSTSSYNAVDGTPFGRDIIKELAEACQRQGIKLHLYYSHLDWRRTDYPLGRTGLGTGRPTDEQNYSAYFDFMNTQLRELLSNYGSIGAVWFDGWWDHDSDPKPFDWRLNEQYALIHSMQPSCLIGNNHHQTPFEGEDIQIFERDLPGENKAGLSGQSIGRLPLESCQTMSDCWGYSLTDNNYKSTRELIQMLVRAAGKNANLLLNVGPQPNGELPQRALERLDSIGQWLSSHGRAIYGTRGGLVAPHDWGVTTQRGDTLFVHILSLDDKALFLPIAGRKLKSAASFDDGEKIAFRQTADGVLLSLPKKIDETDYIVEIVLR